MAKSSKLFEQINAVWENSPSITTKTKPDSIYMTNRFLSLDPDGFMAASDCNMAHKLPEWAALPFLKYSTPKKNAPRNKYPAKVVEGKKLTEKKKIALKLLCTKFNVAEFHGMQIMKLLEQQGFILESS